MYEANIIENTNDLRDSETIDIVIENDIHAKPFGWSRIIDRNPLFLISGVFMLGGCYLVSSAIHAHDPGVIGERHCSGCLSRCW